MKTTLSEISMRDYVSLVCGDMSVLQAHNEVGNKKKLARVRADMMYEFSLLSDPSGTKAALGKRKAEMTNDAEITFFKVCINLMALSSFSEVRPLLARYGIDVDRYDDAGLKREVERLLRRCETESRRQESGGKAEDSEQSADDIRRYYDRQAASLMTYFKFQIDMSVMSASQFAMMIDQASREIKAKLAAMNKR